MAKASLISAGFASDTPDSTRSKTALHLPLDGKPSVQRCHDYSGFRREMQESPMSAVFNSIDISDGYVPNGRKLPLIRAVAEQMNWATIMTGLGRPSACA